MLDSVNEQLLGKVVDVCIVAGEEILKVYNQSGDVSVELKSDDSPVTAADLAAHKVLVPVLKGLLPSVPLLSEEGHLPEWSVRKGWETYWIIDPLDGTKEFINRNGEFTVNVALVHKGKPILGVVYVPVSGITYCGLYSSSEKGAWKIMNGEKTRIESRSLASVSRGDTPFVLVASRRHGAEQVNALINRLEAQFGELQTSSMGSSLKLCLVAEGKADLYPRLALTSEWDTAAAQAVVEAAGGQVLTYNLEDMLYNTKDDILNPFFYVVGDPSHDWPTLLD